MRRGILRGLSAVIVLLLVACQEAAGQFTSGPSGNPSAAGISTGSPPPVPAAPPVIPPPRSSGAPPFVGPPQYPPGGDVIESSQGMLAAEGMPPLLEAYRDSPLARRLNLSSEQLDKLQDLRNKVYRETKDLRYDLLQKRLDMRRLFADPKVDQTTLLSRHRELTSLRVKLAGLVAGAAVEARQLLRPDQIEMFDQLPVR